MLRKTYSNDPVDVREEHEKYFEQEDPRAKSRKIQKEELDTLDGWTDDSNQRS
ncbi:MAG: hypothetical protein IJ333_07520 [Clostridia bacterium]|nr:hypothetical protein [Clostridia bacterium]